MEIFMGWPVTPIRRGNPTRETKEISIDLPGYVYEEETLQEKLGKASWDDQWHGYHKEIWQENVKNFHLVNQDMDM